MEGLTFSPLTSGEFREIDQKPPGYSALLMRTYDEELNNILDIAGLPTGSGAGYGVGVADDELPALDLRYAEIMDLFCDVYSVHPFVFPASSHSDLGSNAPAAPASASLLQDWLDINQLDPDDMDALQKELETGAPDSIMHALDDY